LVLPPPGWLPIVEKWFPYLGRFVYFASQLVYMLAYASILVSLCLLFLCAQHPGNSKLLGLLPIRPAGSLLYNMAVLHQFDYIFALGMIFAFLDAWNIGANDVGKASRFTSISVRDLSG
jgi:hypothetical protein